MGSACCSPGQLDVDLTVYFLTNSIGEIQKREWGWKNARSTWRKGFHGEEYEKLFFGGYIPEDFQRGTWGRSAATQDPKDWQNTGEFAKWLRVKGPAGRSDWLVVLMPNLKGQPAAAVEKLSATSARITLGDESETVFLGSDGQNQAAVERPGRSTVLLKAAEVRPWSELEFKPIPPTIDRGGR